MIYTLPEDIVTHLENNIADYKFPWYWVPEQSGMHQGKRENSEYDFQMSHQFMYGNVYITEYAQAIEPFIEYLKKEFEVKNFIRVKSNMLFRSNPTQAQLDYLYHIDDTRNFMSAVYYVIDSDGDTVIQYGSGVSRVKPNRGNMVLFNSNLMHRASPPSFHDRRIVINCIFEI